MSINRTLPLIAAALTLASDVPASGRSGFAYGYPASPDAKRRKAEAKLARAPLLLAKAEAKRARKAARRKP